jgi:hypothetical protein
MKEEKELSKDAQAVLIGMLEDRKEITNKEAKKMLKKLKEEKEKIIEKREKESYEKGWKDGRKELAKEIEKKTIDLNKTDFREIEQEIRRHLIEEIEEKNKLLVEGFLDDFKKGYIKPTELFNAYATHVEIMLENLKKANRE